MLFDQIENSFSEPIWLSRGRGWVHRLSKQEARSPNEVCSCVIWLDGTSANPISDFPLCVYTQDSNQGHCLTLPQLRCWDGGCVCHCWAIAARCVMVERYLLRSYRNDSDGYHHPWTCIANNAQLFELGAGSSLFCLWSFVMLYFLSQVCVKTTGENSDEWTKPLDGMYIYTLDSDRTHNRMIASYRLIATP